MKKYDNLDALVQNDQEANKFFNTLPNYVQDQICQRKQNVNSLESLKDYAENLLRGDN